MASLSVVVAAHPKRKLLVDQLLERLPSDAVAVFDDKDDEWDTHRRSWRAALLKGRDYGLVLQDDAIISRNLVPALETALAHIPGNSVVSLYFGNAKNHPKIVRAVRRADEEDASWIVTSGTWWGVGIILPTELIPNMLEFCERRREVYDRRLSIWCEHDPQGPYQVYYPWPSLVDHLDEDSLVKPGRAPGRKAFRFIGEDADALSWDPAKGAVPCGRVTNKSTTLRGNMQRK